MRSDARQTIDKRVRNGVRAKSAKNPITILVVGRFLLLLCCGWLESCGKLNAVKAVIVKATIAQMVSTKTTNSSVGINQNIDRIQMNVFCLCCWLPELMLRAVFCEYNTATQRNITFPRKNSVSWTIPLWIKRCERHAAEPNRKERQHQIE